MQITTLAKQIVAGASGLGAIAVLALTWQQLNWPWFASAADVEDLSGRFEIHSAQVEAQIDARAEIVQKQIDTLFSAVTVLTLTNLYNEEERLQDKIDDLAEQSRRDPSNAALRLLLRTRERELKDVHRKIDAMNKGG